MRKIRRDDIKDAFTSLGLLLVYGFFMVIFFGGAYDSNYGGFLLSFPDPLVIFVGFSFISIAWILQRNNKAEISQIAEQLAKLKEVEKTNFEYLMKSFLEFDGQKDSAKFKKLEKEWKLHFERVRAVEWNYLKQKESKIENPIKLFGYLGLFLVTLSFFILIFDRLFDWTF
jgi:hypothetical protein